MKGRYIYTKLVARAKKGKSQGRKGFGQCELYCVSSQLRASFTNQPRHRYERGMKAAKEGQSASDFRRTHG